MNGTVKKMGGNWCRKRAASQRGRAGLGWRIWSRIVENQAQSLTLLHTPKAEELSQRQSFLSHPLADCASTPGPSSMGSKAPVASRQGVAIGLPDPSPIQRHPAAPLLIFPSLARHRSCT